MRQVHYINVLSWNSLVQWLVYQTVILRLVVRYEFKPSLDQLLLP